MCTLQYSTPYLFIATDMLALRNWNITAQVVSAHRQNIFKLVSQSAARTAVMQCAPHCSVLHSATLPCLSRRCIAMINTSHHCPALHCGAIVCNVLIRPPVSISSLPCYKLWYSTVRLPALRYASLAFAAQRGCRRLGSSCCVVFRRVT
jgi:hypothetical protein